MELSNKRIVITGAAQGLGKAYAEEVARQGAALVLNDIDEELLEQTAHTIRKGTVRVTTVCGSVANWQDAERIVNSCVNDFGGIDAIVNNAGVHYVSSPETEDPRQIQQLIEVNVLGTIYPGLHAIRQMLKQNSGGVILNVSAAAAAGLAMTATYGASKGAISALTWNWALELRTRGIRVNAVSPSAYTPLVRKSLALRDSVVNWGPEVVAPLVVYLLSDRSKSVTGQVVRLWRNELHLIKHHGPMEPVLVRDVWTVEEFTRAFEDELRAHLQPYGRDMKTFIPFT